MPGLPRSAQHKPNPTPAVHPPPSITSFLPPHLLASVIPSAKGGLIPDELSFLASTGIGDHIPVLMGGKDPRRRIERALAAGQDELLWEISKRERETREGLTSGSRMPLTFGMTADEGDETDMYGGALDANMEDQTRDVTRAGDRSLYGDTTWTPTATRERQEHRLRIDKVNRNGRAFSGMTTGEDSQRKPFSHQQVE